MQPWFVMSQGWINLPAGEGFIVFAKLVAPRLPTISQMQGASLRFKNRGRLAKNNLKDFPMTWTSYHADNVLENR